MSLLLIRRQNHELADPHTRLLREAVKREQCRVPYKMVRCHRLPCFPICRLSCFFCLWRRIGFGIGIGIMSGTGDGPPLAPFVQEDKLPRILVFLDVRPRLDV